MATILTGITGFLGLGGGAAATGAAAAGAGAAAATTAASGISLATILQGTATVLGVISSIAAGNAEGDQLDLQAKDAEREIPLENLQGIERRTSIKRALADQIGEENVAYAASGLDLSFGTAAQARSAAVDEADRALSIDSGTQEVRTSRLMERAANYRIGAKRARKSGLINGLVGGLEGFAGIAQRGA